MDLELHQKYELNDTVPKHKLRIERKRYMGRKCGEFKFSTAYLMEGSVEEAHV